MEASQGVRMTGVRRKGCPSPPFFLLAADWLMLLSGQRVPGEHEEARVICGGFYKQRQAWKWWDEILAKGRNDKSIRNAFHFSLLLFPPHSMCLVGTAVAITLVYVAPFPHMQHVRDPQTCLTGRSERWTWTCQICLMVKLQLDLLPGTSICTIVLLEAEPLTLPFFFFPYCQWFCSCPVTLARNLNGLHNFNVN